MAESVRFAKFSFLAKQHKTVVKFCYWVTERLCFAKSLQTNKQSVYNAFSNLRTKARLSEAK